MFDIVQTAGVRGAAAGAAGQACQAPQQRGQGGQEPVRAGIQLYCSTLSTTALQGLLDGNDDAYNFASLCRGEELRPGRDLGLDCSLQHTTDPFTRLQPAMVEQVHREPDILLYHNIVSGQELRDIKQAAGPLVGSD